MKEKVQKEEKNERKNVNNKGIIISLIIGLLLGGLISYFIFGLEIEGRVAGKLLTKNKLYNKMKDYYSINLVLEDVDAAILNKKYKLTDTEKEEIENMANKYIKQYEQYGFTRESFLSENGFKDYDAFIDFLTLDQKRTMYFYDYLESKLEDGAVKKFYDENAFGKIENKHILVKVSEKMPEGKALNIANEIIKKLDEGKNFDEVKKEYLEQYKDNIVSEELGEIGAFDSLEPAYMDALKTLEKDQYTKTPVKTSYGYHIIYCIDKKEKTEEIERKDKMAIIDTLAAEQIKPDAKLFNEAMIEMRKEAKLKFTDKTFNKKYEEYLNKNKPEENNKNSNEKSEKNENKKEDK